MKPKDKFPLWSRCALPAIFTIGVLISLYAKAFRQKLKDRIIVSSSAFRYGQAIPPKYTSEGEDLSPPLTLQNVPLEAKSLVLIAEDHDASGGPRSHWLAWNIDPKTEEIAEGSRLGGAILGHNDFQKLNYSGPSFTTEYHRIYFKVFALNTILDLPKGSSKEELKKAIEQHSLAQGSLMGKVGKSPTNGA